MQGCCRVQGAINLSTCANPVLPLHVHHDTCGCPTAHGTNPYVHNTVKINTDTIMILTHSFFVRRAVTGQCGTQRIEIIPTRSEKALHALCHSWAVLFVVIDQQNSTRDKPRCGCKKKTSRWLRILMTLALRCIRPAAR